MLPQELLAGRPEAALLRRGHPPGARELPSTGRIFEAPSSTISHLAPESSLPTALVQPEAQGLTMTVKRMFEALNRPLGRVPKGLISEGKVTFGKGEPDPTDLFNAVRKMAGRKELGKTAERVLTPESGTTVKDVPALRKLASLMWKTGGKKGSKEVSNLLKQGKVTEGQVSHNLSNELMNLAVEGGEMTPKNYEKVQTLMELFTKGR